MSQPEEMLTQATTNKPATYCRRCGYELRGLTTPRCPECGSAFDLADPRTFRYKPIRHWLRHAKRVAIVMTTFVILLTAAWGWVFWGWYSEQKSLVALNAIQPVLYRPIIPPRLRDHLGYAGFVLDRADSVLIYDTGSEIRDLSPLAGLKYVQRIEIFVRDIKGLSPLAGLTNLKYLYIAGTNAPIQDVSPLFGLKSLRLLYMSRDSITEDQARELKRMLPDCSIEFD